VDFSERLEGVDTDTLAGQLDRRIEEDTQFTEIPPRLARTGCIRFEARA
jgi:hypothetical protein